MLYTLIEHVLSTNDSARYIRTLEERSERNMTDTFGFEASVPFLSVYPWGPVSIT